MPTELTARPTHTEILARPPARKSLIYDKAQPVHGLGPARDSQWPAGLAPLGPLGTRDRQPRNRYHARHCTPRNVAEEHARLIGGVVTSARRPGLASRSVLGRRPCQSLLPLVRQRILPLRLTKLLRSSVLAAVVAAVALPGVAAPAHRERPPATLTPQLPDPIHEAVHGNPVVDSAASDWYKLNSAETLLGGFSPESSEWLLRALAFGLSRRPLYSDIPRSAIHHARGTPFHQHTMAPSRQRRRRRGKGRNLWWSARPCARRCRPSCTNSNWSCGGDCTTPFLRWRRG